MTKLKANHDLLLPDGKTHIKAGETFEYDGDFSSFASVVEEVRAEEKKPATPKEPAKTAKKGK